MYSKICIKREEKLPAPAPALAPAPAPSLGSVLWLRLPALCSHLPFNAGVGLGFHPSSGSGSSSGCGSTLPLPPPGPTSPTQGCATRRSPRCAEPQDRRRCWHASRGSHRRLLWPWRAAQMCHGGPEPAPLALARACWSQFALPGTARTAQAVPRQQPTAAIRQPFGSCEAAIVGGQSRPPAPWPSCPGTRAGRCRPCTTGDRGSAQPANERVSGCHVSTKRLPPVAFQRRTGRADG
jgi:hypothetical protein